MRKLLITATPEAYAANGVERKIIAKFNF